MTDHSLDPRSAPSAGVTNGTPAPAHRRQRRRSPVALGGLVVVVLLLWVGWLGYTGAAAQRELRTAQRDVKVLENSLLAANVAAADSALASVQRTTARARSLTSDPIWKISGKVPLIGRTPRSVSGLAAAVASLAEDALPAVREAGVILDPKNLRVGGATIATAPFVKAVGPLTTATEAIDQARSDIEGLPRRFVLGPVSDARRELLDQLDHTSESATRALGAARIIPGMLGAEEPRRYFLAIQNNAESRGSGGLLGAYGIIEASNGKLSLVTVGSNSSLPKLPEPAIDIGETFNQRYAKFEPAQEWRNTNVSPDFPSVHAMYAAMYQKAKGQKIDGSIAVDPVALSYILKVTGPAKLGKQSVTAANVVDLTERDVYARIKHPPDQDIFFQALARAVYERITSGAGSTKGLVDALGRAGGEGHLLMASSHKGEQALLAKAPVGGAIPVVSGPYLHVGMNNVGGNKLDYYLHRTIDYKLEPRDDGTGRATVTVTLTNKAPRLGLPEYVTQRLDPPDGKARPVGQNRVYLSVYAGLGASAETVTLDGEPLRFEPLVERGHGVFSTYLAIDPGQTRRLVFAINEPRFADEVTYRPFPMAHADKVTITVK
jgi:hypothetical protein